MRPSLGSCRRTAHCGTTGVEPDASDAELRKAFRLAAKRNHPDKGGDIETFKKINEAWQVLCCADTHTPGPSDCTQGDYAHQPPACCTYRRRRAACPGTQRTVRTAVRVPATGRAVRTAYRVGHPAWILRSGRLTLALPLPLPLTLTLTLALPLPLPLTLTLTPSLTPYP